MVTRKGLRAWAGAALSLAMVMSAGAGAAFPTSTPSAPATARLEAELNPHFGELIHPRLHRYSYGRPRWAPYWRGRYYGGYGGAYGGGYDPGYGGFGPPPGYGDQGPTYGGYPGGGSPEGYASGGGYILDGQFVPGPAPGYGGAYGGAVSSGYGGGYGDPSWGWDPHADPSTYGPPVISVFGGGQSVARVDCREANGGQLSAAVATLAPGGVLYLKGRGPACEGTLNISQPIVIAGEQESAFARGPEAGPATIKAPPGSPCAVVAVGPKGGVEFRDLVLEQEHGDGQACLQSWDSAVALVRVSVQFAGHASAIYAHGGQMFFNDVLVNAASDESAIWSEDAALVLRNVRIDALSTAIDARPGAAAGVSLDHVSLQASAGGGRDERNSVGILARRGRTPGGGFDLRHVRISGFSTGLIVERGDKAVLNRVRIGKSRIGIGVDGGSVEVSDSGLDAREWGLYAYSGEATVSRTHVFSALRMPIGGDPGATFNDRELTFYSDRGCGLFERHDWSCRSSHDLPRWLVSDEDAGPHHWGWDPVY